MSLVPDDTEILEGLPSGHVAAARLRRRGLLFVALAVAGAQVTMAIQMGLNANFLKNDLGISGFQFGMLEAARESCGVIAFGILALLAGIAEPFIGMAMLFLLAIGIGSYYHAYSYSYVLLLSLVWSQGLHVWMPLPNSMTLALAEKGRAGFRLGQVQSAGSAGYGVGLVAALLLTWGLHVPMRPLYLVAGTTAALAAAACLGIPRQIKSPGPRLVFRRKYGLYYVLCLLEGWRKQISISFAGFLLVERYKASVETILLLMAIVQVVGYTASPRVGKLIDRIGERKVLLFYYGTLAFLFAGYALIPNPHLLYVVFIVDGSFFIFLMALTTYVNRIAPKNEHTPTLSMGVAMNHVAAVTMPLVGGFLWKFAGPKWAFLTGVVTASLSILAVLRIPRHTPESH